MISNENAGQGRLLAAFRDPWQQKLQPARSSLFRQVLCSLLPDIPMPPHPYKNVIDFGRGGMHASQLSACVVDHNMSRLKRKAHELGEQGLSAAVGEIAARTVSAAVGRYDAHATVDEQLERLATLAVMCHSAVEAAERVQVRSWWLRRWLWRLRDAAADADEVLRSLRQRRARAADEEAAADGPARVSKLWNAARRVLEFAKSVLFAGDEDVRELSSTVARLEKVANGIGDFLKLIELEIRVSLPEPSPSQFKDSQPLPRLPLIAMQLTTPPRPLPPMPAPPPIASTSSPPLCWASLRRSQRVSLSSAWDRQNYDLFHISHDEYNARRRNIILLMAKRNIRRAMDKLRRKAPPEVSFCFQPHDPGRLHALASDIHEALGAIGNQGVQGRSRLAEWRRELQAVADRADRVLLRLTAPAQPDNPVPDDDDDDVRRAVRSVETAAAHLGDFMALLRIRGMTVEGVMFFLCQCWRNRHHALF